MHINGFKGIPAKNERFDNNPEWKHNLYSVKVMNIFLDSRPICRKNCNVIQSRKPAAL